MEQAKAEEEKRETARNFKNMGIAIQDIAKGTGLTIDEIESLQPHQDLNNTVPYRIKIANTCNPYLVGKEVCRAISGTAYTFCNYY